MRDLTAPTSRSAFPGLAASAVWPAASTTPMRSGAES